MGLFTCCFGGPAAAGHSSGPHPDASTTRDAGRGVSQPASSGVRFIASHVDDTPPLKSTDACTAYDNSADTQSRSLELTNELEPTMHGPSYAGVWRGRSVAVRYLRLPSTMLEPALDLSLQHPHVVQTLRLRPVASCQQGTGEEENRAPLSRLPPKVKKLAEKLLLGEELMEVVTEHCSWGSLYTALQADANPPKQQQSPPADPPSSAANHGRHASPGQPQPAASATEDRQLAVSLLRCASSGAQAAAGPPIINSSSTTTDRLLAVLQTAADVARGMHYLHSKSRVHGSLRPATVLLAPGGCPTRRFQAKVSDQGLPDQLPLPPPPPPPLRRPTQLAQQQLSRPPADGPPDSPQPSQPATSLTPDTECDTYDTTTGVFHTAASTVAAIVAAETAAGRPGNAGWGPRRNGSRSSMSQGSPCRTSYDPGSDSSPSCTHLPTPAAEGALLQGEGAGEGETGPGPSSCRATSPQQEQGRMAGQGRTHRPVAGSRQAGDNVALPPSSSSSGSGDRDGGSGGEAGPAAPAPPAPPPTHPDNPRSVSFLTAGGQQARSAAEQSSSEEQTAAAGPAAGRGEVAGGGDPHRPAVYRAPEAWGGARTAASDVWSFGVLLHCLVTGGAAPYPGLEDEQVMRGVTSGILQLHWPPGVHPQVRQLCLSCLELNPELRPDFSLISTFLDKLVAKVTAAQQGQGPHSPTALRAPADLSPSTFSPPSHHQRETLTTTTTTITTPLPTRTYSPDATTAAARSSRDKSTEMVSIGAAVSAAVQVPPPSTKHPVAWEEALASLQTAMRQQQKLSQGRAAHWQGTCSTVFSSTNSSQSQQPSSSGAVRGCSSQSQQPSSSGAVRGCSSQSQQPSSSGAVGGHGCRQPGGRGSEAGKGSGGTAPELTTVGSSPQSWASPHQHRQLFLQQQQQQWQQQQQQQRPVFQQQQQQQQQQQLSEFLAQQQQPPQQQQELLSQSQSDAGVRGPPCPPLCPNPSLTASQLTPPNHHLTHPPGHLPHPPPWQQLATAGQPSQAPAPPLPLLGAGSTSYLPSPPAPASLCLLPSQQSSDSMALPAGVPLPQPAWPAAPQLLAGPPPLTLDPAPVVGDAAGQAEGEQPPAGVDPELLAFWGMATKQPSCPLPSPLNSLGLLGTPSPAESGSLVLPGPPSLPYHTHPPRVHTPPHNPHAGLGLGGGSGGGLSSSVGPHLLATRRSSEPLSPALSSELGSDPGLATELHSLAAAAARQLSELMSRDREGKAAAGAAGAAAAARQPLGSRSWQVRSSGQPPGPLAAPVTRQRSRTLAALSGTRADQSWSSPLLLLRSPLSLPDPSSPPPPATLMHSCQDIARTVTSSSVGGLEQGRGSCTSGNGSGQQQGQQPSSALHSSARGSVATSGGVSSDVTADVPEGEEHDQVGGLEAFPPVGRSHRTRSSSRRHHHHTPPPKAVRLGSPVISPPHPPSVPPPLPPPVHLHPTSPLQPARGVTSTTPPEGKAPASPTSRPSLIRLSHPGPPPPLLTSTPQLSVLTPGPGPSRLSAPGSVPAAGQSAGGSWAAAAGPTSSLQHTITSWQGAGAPRQPPYPPTLLADSHGPATLLAGMQAQSPSQPHPARISHIPPETGHTSLPLHTSLPKPHRTLVLHQLPGLPAAAAAAARGQGQGRLRPAWPTGPDLSPLAPPYRSAPATTHQGTQAWAGLTVGGQGPPGTASQALPGDARFSSSPAAGGHISWAALVPELEEEGPPSGAGT